MSVHSSAHLHLNRSRDAISGPNGDRVVGSHSDMVGDPSLCQISILQSVIVGSSLYIFGKDTSHTPREQATDQVVLRLDLSVSFTTNNHSIQSIDPAVPGTDQSVMLERTGVFADSKNIFRIRQVKVSQNNSRTGTEASPDGFRTQKLLVFNTETRSWSRESLLRIRFVPPIYGSLISIVKEGLGFWVGGVVNAANQEAQNLLRRFDMTSRAWTIEETPFHTILNGSTVFLPIGEKGILLHFAGQHSRGTHEPDVILNSFEIVRIYDIASHRWYMQKTSEDVRIRNATIESAANLGGIPHGRLNPCAVAIKSNKNSRSSYHIYMVGGSWGDTVFDEVWVLSVPSFRWTLLKQNSSMPSISQCHLVGKSQLLLLADQNISITGNCTSDLVKIFDLNSLDWVTTYIPHSKDYISANLLLDATQQDSPCEGFSSPFVGGLFYIPPASSSLKPRQPPRNSSMSSKPVMSTSSIPSNIEDFTSSSNPVSDQTSTVLTQTTTSVNSYPTTTHDQATQISTFETSTARARTISKEWQKTTGVPDTTDEAKSTSERSVVITEYSSHTSTDSRIQSVETKFPNSSNISTTTLFSKTGRVRTQSTTQAFSSKPTHIRDEAITIISTVQLPQKTVTMHMTVSNTDKESSKTITTSYKRKTISTHSINDIDSGMSATEVESFTKFTETSAPTAGTTATDEDDTVSPQPTNLKPYQGTTGIIAGSVIGGLGMIGGVTIILIIYCCRAQHRRKKKRNSMSQDLLDFVPQKRGLHSVDIQNLPPVVTRNRKSRMDWVRFSRARGLHEVFELE
ncbi:hypothetical protein TWF506_009202 [Arthrobotrys conoides]|uniref:Kelch repeat protein n=1 Tax=Arthrobotrys conoides TaxID=74498 RepID=A0AAN8NDE2_9PEZI